MTSCRIGQVTYGRLIKQLEAVVAAGGERLHVLKTETAILDADKKWKRTDALQLLEYIHIDALDVDLEVVRRAEFLDEACQRDATDVDSSNSATVASSPVDVEAAPMVIVQIDVKGRAFVSLPDCSVDNRQAAIVNRRTKSFLSALTESWIGFKRDDIESAVKIV